jgi:hypothetical protein
MRKRDEGISSAWSFLFGTIILLIVVPGVLIGPARAVRIIASTFTSAVFQGTIPPAAAAANVQERPTLPLVQLDGQDLVYDGLQYPISIDGDRISFTAVDELPFGPYRNITIKEVQKNDEATSSIALWIAGRVGVPTAFQELVYLERDGDDAVVAVLSEEVDASFERYRNAAETDVPVLVFDPFEPGSAGTEGAAAEKMKEVTGTVMDTMMDPAAMRTQLDSVLDVDAFLDLYAALQIAGSRDSRYRYAMVLSPRTNKFYPVLMNASLMPAEQIKERDLLWERLFSVAEWRSRYENKIAEGLDLLRDDPSLQEKLNELSSGAAPVEVAAGGARRKLFSGGGDIAIVTTGNSEEPLADRLRSHWERIRVPPTTQAP